MPGTPFQQPMRDPQYLQNSAIQNPSLRSTSLSESERHRVLSAKCRRVLLEELEDGSKPVSVETMAAKLAKRANQSVPDDPDELLIELHHRHLPVLDDVDLIDYDPSACEIR